jgi:hypothetical protein
MEEPSVRVRAIDLTIGQWVVLLLKITIASIPAALVFVLLFYVVLGTLLRMLGLNIFGP